MAPTFGPDLNLASHEFLAYGRPETLASVVKRHFGKCGRVDAKRRHHTTLRVGPNRALITQRLIRSKLTPCRPRLVVVFWGPYGHDITHDGPADDLVGLPRSFQSHHMKLRVPPSISGQPPGRPASNRPLGAPLISS